MGRREGAVGKEKEGEIEDISDKLQISSAPAIFFF